MICRRRRRYESVFIDIGESEMGRRRRTTARSAGGEVYRRRYEFVVSRAILGPSG